MESSNREYVVGDRQQLVDIDQVPISATRLMTASFVFYISISTLVVPFVYVGASLMAEHRRDPLSLSWSMALLVGYLLLPLIIFIACFIPFTRQIGAAESITDWARCRWGLVRWVFIMATVAIADIIMLVLTYVSIKAVWVGNIQDIVWPHSFMMLFETAATIYQIRRVSLLIIDHPNGVRVY